MDSELYQDLETLLRLSNGKIGLRKGHKEIVFPRVIGYIHELGSFRGRNYPSEIGGLYTIIKQQGTELNRRDEIINKLDKELDYWKREAISDKAKLGEIRILKEIQEHIGTTVYVTPTGGYYYKATLLGYGAYGSDPCHKTFQVEIKNSSRNFIDYFLEIYTEKEVKTIKGGE